METAKRLEELEKEIQTLKGMLISSKGPDLSDYFGILEESEVLEDLAEDTRRLRESSKFRL